jgi:Fe-S oxidoreductase
MMETNEINKIFEDIYKCYSCGKCTSVCPLSTLGDFSPRIVAENWILGLNKEKIKQDIWTCLTCGNCAIYCPMLVNFPEFVRNARLHFLDEEKFYFEESHHEIFSTISRLMANPNYIGESRFNLFKDLKVAETGEYLYFMGCLPFFEIIFDYPYTDIARNAVKILNLLDIKPAIIKNERCCGHDLLWNGDIENFKKLAELNIKAIENSGAKKIITTCGEGYRTLKLDYPKYFGKLDFEVISFSELIESRIRDINFPYEFPHKVTYHDSCRLGKHMKVFEAPRNVIKAIPGIDYREMPRNRENSLCCGISAWHCNLLTKSIRMDRLGEAESVADIVVTTCPKCKIHFECLKNENVDGASNMYKIEVMDLPSLLTRALFL